MNLLYIKIFVLKKWKYIKMPDLPFQVGDLAESRCFEKVVIVVHGLDASYQNNLLNIYRDRGKAASKGFSFRSEGAKLVSGFRVDFVFILYCLFNLVAFTRYDDTNMEPISGLVAIWFSFGVEVNNTKLFVVFIFSIFFIWYILPLLFAQQLRMNRTCHLGDLMNIKKKKVLQCVNEVHSLCSVLGLDFGQTVGDVHPSLHGTQVEQSTNISNSTLEGLEQAILKLKIERKTRISEGDFSAAYLIAFRLNGCCNFFPSFKSTLFLKMQLKDVMAKLFELWNLMDSSKEERNCFMKITSIVETSESEITERGVLSTEMIEKASAEVDRLAKLKASRMKELVFKKRSELEEICRLTHIEPNPSTVAEKASALIDSGMFLCINRLFTYNLHPKSKNRQLRQKMKLSRKEVTDRIDKWFAACEEENWLDKYNQDDNRYSAGQCTHINLKRAEHARITIGKIPTIVDNLINKTLAWEDENKTYFLYDGTSFEVYVGVNAMQQKEEDKRDDKGVLGLGFRVQDLGIRSNFRRVSSFPFLHLGDKEFIHLSCTTLPVPTVQHHQALLTWKFFTMVTAGTKKPQVSVPTPPPPPWKINLQKYAESRALELHSLQSIIENRVNSDYRSQKNKRRRTTVFDNQIARKGCRRKRQKLGIIDKALAKSGLEENHQKKLPRCVHRRYELKKNLENVVCYDQALGLPPSFVSSMKLHQCGAPVSQTIAPFGQHEIGNDSNKHGVELSEKSGKMKHSSSFRRLWVWINSSAFEEGYENLQISCQKEMKKRVISINCFSLEENYWQLKKHVPIEEESVSQIRNSSILRNEDYFSSCAMLSLNVKDPRELPWKKTVVPVESISTKTPSDAQEKKYKEVAELGGILEENRDLSSLSRSKLVDSQFDIDGSMTRGLRPPVEDSYLSKEKHHERMVNFCLDDIHSGEVNSTTTVQCSRCCPILLLKNDMKELTIG
ncbi:65-kDa microtubule-associated protein 6 [Glycine soja]